MHQHFMDDNIHWSVKVSSLLFVPLRITGWMGVDAPLWTPAPITPTDFHISYCTAAATAQFLHFVPYFPVPTICAALYFHSWIARYKTRPIQCQLPLVIRGKKKTSSQKLGRCASRRISSVWKSLGQERFESKNVSTQNTCILAFLHTFILISGNHTKTQSIFIIFFHRIGWF